MCCRWLLEWLRPTWKLLWIQLLFPAIKLKLRANTDSTDHNAGTADRIVFCGYSCAQVTQADAQATVDLHSLVKPKTFRAGIAHCRARRDILRSK